MLLFVYTTTHKRFVIFTCRYFKLSWNTTAVSQSNCSNFSYSSIKFLFIFNWLINSCTFSRNQGRAPQWSKWKLKMQKSKNKWLHVFKRSLTVMLQRCCLMLHKIYATLNTSSCMAHTYKWQGILLSNCNLSCRQHENYKNFWTPTTQ